MTETLKKLELFGGMIRSVHELYLWVFDRQLTLHWSNCPDQALAEQWLSLENKREQWLSVVSGHRKPVQISWLLPVSCVVMAPGDPEDMICVLGPYLSGEFSPEDLKDAVERYAPAPDLYSQTEAFFRRLPLISQVRVIEYTIMLYYCLTGEQITVSDFHYRDMEKAQGKTEPERTGQVDIHGTYAMEREMLRMVREGNLDYRRHMNRMAMTGNIGKLSNGDQDRQMKNTVLVCAVLFSRAAIEGGLAPEIAMTLTDQYFQSVEACSSMAELSALSQTMQDDFVWRVHRARTSMQSKMIQECCDYMDLHLKEDLTLKGMAARLGYCEDYLSHRFKREMGVNFRDYLNRRRLEQAKDLLRDNTVTVKQVSETLHFCSPSYFAEMFKQAYGLSPTQWRAET